MAQNFIPLEDAAQKLGISVDDLKVLRERGDIHAYRDGSSWQFKESELDRVKQDLESGDLTVASGRTDGSSLDLGDEQDTILLSEAELGEGSGPKSTIIGKDSKAGDPDSDVNIVEAKSDSDLDLIQDAGEESSVGLHSDVKLADDQEDIVAGTSDILLDDPFQSKSVSADDTKGSGLGSQFEDIEELDLDLEGQSSKILSKHLEDSAKQSEQKKTTEESSDISLGGSDLDLAGSDITLSDEGDVLDIGEIPEDEDPDAVPTQLGVGGSDLDLSELAGEGGSDLTGSADSTLELAVDEDDELVLGEGSGTGSDITLSSEDSGIGLINPSDSGLALDQEPLELSGSNVESLEIDDGELTLEEEIDNEAATQLKADDDFMLTPLEELSDDETEDSGSQVIALDSESFDDASETMLGTQADAIFADELGDTGGAEELVASGAILASAPARPEAPFSIWTVMFLVLVALMMFFAGFMMYDLLRNMWSWNETMPLNSDLMDGLVKQIPLFNPEQ